MTEIFKHNLIPEQTVNQILYGDAYGAVAESDIFSDSVPSAPSVPTTPTASSNGQIFTNPRIIGGIFEGGSFRTANSGARVEMFPNEDYNIGIRIKDDAGSDVFKALIGGTDVGDVIIGDSSGQHAKWDKSAATFAITGTVTADLGLIGAWTISSVALYHDGATDAVSSGMAPADYPFYAGKKYVDRATAPFRVTPAGALFASSVDVAGKIVAGTGSSIASDYLSGIIAQANLNVSNRGWVQTSVFSITDADTIAWAAGTLTSADGTAYSISAGNTGNMTAKTYIYLDTAVSSTAYQITTTATTAVGVGKVLVAIAQNGTGEATYKVMSGQGGENIDAANIVAGSITGNEIAASTITAGKISVVNLAAISADIGAITAGSISVVAGANTIGLTPTGTYAIFSGTTGSPEFSVTPAGVVTATKVIASNLMLYEAVVDAAGNGDYADIQSAIDAGAKNIFVRAGTYTLSADITLVSGILIQGEDKYTTIINLNGDNQVKAVGDTPYQTGSIAVTNGSATITGTDTLWSSNLAANDYIYFNNNVYKITAVNSDTDLTIEIVYEGKTETGISDYDAGTFKSDIEIRDITITGQDTNTNKGALYFDGVVKSVIDNVIITKNDLAYTRGFYLYDSYNNNIKDFNVSNNGLAGMDIQFSHSNSFINIYANNNAQYGVYITTSYDNTFYNINANNNGIGIRWSGGKGNIITNGIFNNNLYHGVSLSASDNNQINNSLMKNNGRYGIQIYGSDENNIVNNTVKDNSQETNNTYSEIILENSSIYNIVAGNNINATKTNKSQYGIREAAAADNYNLVHGNIVQGAVTANISLQGANSVNADNI